MSQDDKNKKNIVRDRTLVLRILVPGLHTCLNDKINAKKEEDPVLSSSAAASSGRISADQLWNLDGVTCLPSSEGSTLWRFRWVSSFCAYKFYSMHMTGVLQILLMLI